MLSLAHQLDLHSPARIAVLCSRLCLASPAPQPRTHLHSLQSEEFSLLPFWARQHPGRCLAGFMNNHWLRLSQHNAAPWCKWLAHPDLIAGFHQA